MWVPLIVTKQKEGHLTLRSTRSPLPLLPLLLLSVTPANSSMVQTHWKCINNSQLCNMLENQQTPQFTLFWDIEDLLGNQNQAITVFNYGPLNVRATHLFVSYSQGSIMGVIDVGINEFERVEGVRTANVVERILLIVRGNNGGNEGNELGELGLEGGALLEYNPSLILRNPEGNGVPEPSTFWMLFMLLLGFFAFPFIMKVTEIMAFLMATRKDEKNDEKSKVG